ncbi:MAG: alanine racemase [Candidatus Marinimicrobia bacterium]|nr:alanine racemase [Candidatus Neomarinimicrobiota bacterium]MCF7840003.1 alanine racemase [Candidatus Neomarinimicrobiota bacterium]
MRALCHISADALIHNYSRFKIRSHSALIIPVVKANAYGHGAIPVMKILREDFEIPLVAVATLEESQEVARVYPDVDILVFSRIFPHELNDLPPRAIGTITSWEDYVQLDRAATRPISVHLNVNTGMNRLGLAPDEVLAVLKHTSRYLNITGVYSHLSSADTPNEVSVLKQKHTFNQLCDRLNEKGFEGLKHLSNSAGILTHPELSYDAIRLGIGLYGYDTTPEQKFLADLKPVMTVTAPLVRQSILSAGEPVSYGETWRTSTKSRLGTLRIGYADGYRRALSNRGLVTCEGYEFPVVGTVTMDHIMIDLGETDVKPGQYFTVLGGKNKNTAVAVVSQRLGTIPYEICCGISPRVERVYDDE